MLEFHVRTVPGGWVSRAMVAHVSVGEVWRIGTPLAVEEAAARAGFSSSASLRQHFQRRFGCSPTGYRDRFAPSSRG